MEQDTFDVRNLAFPVFVFAKRAHIINSDHNLLINCLSSATQRCVQLVFVNVFSFSQEKNNRFPFLDILGCLKNTHKNPKFGRVRQVPIRELGWEFPGWDLSYFAKFGIFVGIL